MTLEYPTISRTHAVLTRYDDGSWTIMDAGSTGGVLVNGKPAQLAVVQLSLIHIFYYIRGRNFSRCLRKQHD